MRAAASVQFRAVELDPAPDAAGMNKPSPFQRHLSHVRKGNAEPQVPPHTPENDVTRIVTPFERRRLWVFSGRRTRTGRLPVVLGRGCLGIFVEGGDVRAFFWNLAPDQDARCRYRANHFPDRNHPHFLRVCGPRRTIDVGLFDRECLRLSILGFPDRPGSSRLRSPPKAESQLFTFSGRFFFCLCSAGGASYPLQTRNSLKGFDAVAGTSHGTRSCSGFRQDTTFIEKWLASICRCRQCP